MKIGKIILQIGLLSIFYAIGTWIQQTFQLVIPGSLLGMFLLFGLLSAKLLPLRWFELGGETLLAVMPFLLLPSTVGLIDYGSFLLQKGVNLFVTTVISTFLIIVIAGHTGQYLANRKEKKIS
ncbi:CidA/LrgA family holin-like protein [Priestia abyssalis]|uniref:CidA/LrgA family holin-like protein n=1 Tax=Priestia abyssalis TaxID=1221450 RepID=UPI000994D964|nr:CidA/LrgA family holin-like protein [Priestia abyssalis]